MIMELSTLVFLIRYSTTVNIQKLKAVSLTHYPREQHLNGSKDIFITLVVILGYSICFFIYNEQHILTLMFFFFFFFFVENSQVTIWGQSAGAGSVMFHVSCTHLIVVEILKLIILKSSSPMAGMTKVSFEQLWRIVHPSAIHHRLILHS